MRDAINVEVIIYFKDPSKKADVKIITMEVGCTKPYYDITDEDIKSVSIRPINLPEKK